MNKDIITQAKLEKKPTLFQWVENQNKYEVFLKNDKALLLSVVGKAGNEFFEVWFKMLRNSSGNADSIFKPRNEDFGVWAWCFYTYPRALKCYGDITRGVKKIIPMEAQV